MPKGGAVLDDQRFKHDRVSHAPNDQVRFSEIKKCEEPVQLSLLMIIGVVNRVYTV